MDAGGCQPSVEVGWAGGPAGLRYFPPMRAVIVGAGTFGASLAWWLARGGHDVTLVDQFEPGDPRATSGGESRLIRCGHGPDATYTASARRARTLWRELEARVRRGAARRDRARPGSPTARTAGRRRRSSTFQEQGIPCERLAPEEGRRLFPSFDPDGLAFLLHEPEAGVLRAQRAVRALARQAAAHGATRGARARDAATARACGSRTGACSRATPSSGRAAPWLGLLFAEHLPIRSTRQELFFFDGGPAWRGGRRARVRRLRPGDLRHARPRRARREGRAGLRRPAAGPRRRAAARDRARARRSRARFLAERFPALADAPLSGSKTCRYELTPDAHFVAAPHPEHAVRLAARRRLGPRLQARPRDGRARRGRARRRRGAAARAVRARATAARPASLRTAGATIRGGVGSAPCTTT